ncbi:hypothetical protein U9M48_004136 [Paspalum notatum var. saurae]|uniref:Uncharacterized protein n=1 Tax=Paspalum notatum var. saurae TaxID=547442 RepID=A0AAQ3PPF8_PASNO
MIDAGSSFPMVPPPLQLPRYSVDARGNAPTSPVPPASWLRTMCSMYWPKGDGGHRNICYLIPHQGPEMELFTTASPRFGIEPRLSSDPRRHRKLWERLELCPEWREVCGGARPTAEGGNRPLEGLLSPVKDRVGGHVARNYDSCIPCDLRPGS